MARHPPPNGDGHRAGPPIDLASTEQAPGDAALAQAEIAARLDAAALLLSNALTVGDVELADAALAALALIDRARLWLRVAA